jgi:hypothetical protein
MNAVSTMSAGTAVATTGYDPFAAYGQEAASGGAFLKFSKGEWLLGQNDDEVPLGRKLVANIEEMAIGWIRWSGGKPAERRMGLLSQGFRPETRDALGYHDESLWDLDNEGRPQDPWNFTNEIPMADPDDGEQMTFSASSKGGIGCIGSLCKAYGRERPARLAAGEVPVIELGRDSYMHPVYKKTYVPVLSIVNWIENGSVPTPQAAAEDGEPAAAAEKPATEKAAGSKTRF